MRRNARAKALISVGLVVVVLAHLAWPNQFDALTIGVLILAVLIWIAPPIESLRLPGIGEITFQKVQELGQRIIKSATQEIEGAVTGVGRLEGHLTVQPRSETRSQFDISTTDPNILLIGLGIEVEKRLRRLAEEYEIPVTRSPI